MKSNNYEKERMRSVHLSIISVLTLAAVAVSAVAILCEWPELWLLPFLLLGTGACWILYVLQMFTEETRLWIYAAVAWAVIIFDGVHVTSLFDISVVAALEFILFCRTDERRIMHVSLAFYFFLCGYHFVQIFRGNSVELSPLTVSQILLHFAIVIIVYWIGLQIIARRSVDRTADEHVITDLKETRKHMEYFLANVSHELRTPINAVMGIGSVMMQTETDEHGRENASNIFRAGQRLSEQIDDILDYTEIDTGKLTASMEPYILTSIVNDVIVALNLYEKEGLPDVLFDVDPDIPLKLGGSARQIKKVLRHLTDNAIKFTQEGGVYVHIYRDVRDYGMNLCIDVQDTGIGMSREELERVRMGTYQADAERSRRAGGLGLGLPIVAGFVRVMNGFQRITSVPGEGTQVHVSIPQQVIDATPCMDVVNPERLRIAFYQNPTKFKVAAVRDYYAQLIFHIIESQQLTLQRVATIEDLRVLLKEHEFTHLFIADEEYNQDPAYFEVLSRYMHVIVVARHGFKPHPSTHVTILKKPLNTFKVIEILNAESPEEARASLYVDREESFDGLRTLVVDDEEMNLIVARGLFTEYGMEVETAHSGFEAVDLVRKSQYDVIFMDHMMPEMDGVETMHRIRTVMEEHGTDAIIIALTANAVSGAREMFVAEGFDGFVAKPIERMELERVLRALLGDRRRRAEQASDTQTE